MNITQNLSPLEGIGLSIGADSQGKENFFKGQIDEAAIFNTALSEVEIRALYIKGFNLQGYCVPDLCGNGVVDEGEDCDGGNRVYTI